MAFVELSSIEAKEIVPGFTARFVHSDHITMAYWDIKAGSTLPDHAHPHEQIANVIEGELKLIVAGESRNMTPGQVAVIPGDVRHSGTAITDCKVIDVFYPLREDYK